jgi:hypothetical protein
VTVLLAVHWVANEDEAVAEVLLVLGAALPRLASRRRRVLAPLV